MSIDHSLTLSFSASLLSDMDAWRNRLVEIAKYPCWRETEVARNLLDALQFGTGYFELKEKLENLETERLQIEHEASELENSYLNLEPEWNRLLQERDELRDEVSRIFELPVLDRDEGNDFSDSDSECEPEPSDLDEWEQQKQEIQAKCPQVQRRVDDVSRQIDQVLEMFVALKNHRRRLQTLIEAIKIQANDVYDQLHNLRESVNSVAGKIPQHVLEEVRQLVENFATSL